MSGGFSNAFGYSKSKTRPTDYQADAYKDLRKPLAQQLKGFLPGQNEDPLGNIPQFQGDLAAPITANEQALNDRLMAEGAGRQALLDSTTAGDFLPGGSKSNPFLAEAISAAQRPTAEAYFDVLDRALPGQFTQAGQRVQPGGSSPFDYAAAIQSRGLANALGDIATNISSQNYEAERSRQQEAIPLGQQEVQTTIANAQQQALPRLIQQYGIDQGLAEFQRRSDQLVQILQLIAGVSAPVVAGKSDAFSVNAAIESHGGYGGSSGGSTSIGGSGGSGAGS